jgi:putative transposase
VLRYRFRIYPNAPQRRALAQAFGCARVVFNDAVAARQAAHRDAQRYPTVGELSRRLITDAKRTPERAWLGGVSAVVLQQALADADRAYCNWFDSLSGKRKGRRVGRPRFRSRKDRRQSVRFTRNARFKVTESGRLRLPKIGDVKVRWSRALPSVPSSVTVTLDAAGRYHASFVVKRPAEPLAPVLGEVGVDLGLTHFATVATDDTHDKVDNPRFLRRAERRLARAQRELSRKQKGGRNREKARRRVARAHARVADARRDWLHKLSTALVRENQAVCVEDLAVASLARTSLAKSINDAGWSQFVTMLEYKAEQHGRAFVKIGRFEPTSQRCSACGVVDGLKPLGVRTWTCATCGVFHDRDVNAARNILAAGRAVMGTRPNASGPDVRRRSAGAVGDEAGTHEVAA